MTTLVFSAGYVGMTTVVFSAGYVGTTAVVFSAGLVGRTYKVMSASVCENRESRKDSRDSLFLSHRDLHTTSSVQVEEGAGMGAGA